MDENDVVFFFVFGLAFFHIQKTSIKRSKKMKKNMRCSLLFPCFCWFTLFIFVGFKSFRLMSGSSSSLSFGSD